MEELGGEVGMAVREYIKKEVGDWDDDLAARSRFKAFSGQFSDWESTFLFWRHLILNVSGHFQFLFIRPSQVSFFLLIHIFFVWKDVIISASFSAEEGLVQSRRVEPFMP